ncbi:MAG: UDP-N-acetylmuramate dehydrogenase [Acidobacteriota bacterium]
MTEALRQAGIPHREREPLSRHTTMGVGGEAAVMALPRTSEELRTALRIRADLDAPHRVLGGGSNLVVADEGLDELVVNTEALRTVTVGEDGTTTAEAGANLIQTALKCSRAGWRGLESAVGIPGSVGGAAVMNAGAYGFSISDAMKEIVVFDEDGERTEPPEGWRFRYRGSSIPEGAAVASVTLGLERDDPAALEEETRAIAEKRRTSQPGGRNAGCVFKNPAEGHAGRMIDALGLKGLRRGKAVVSPRHANFVVNEGGASAVDVLGLIDELRERVRAANGVDLELEVKVWRSRS